VPGRLLILGGLFLAVVGPIAAAATSPYLAFREPIYILAGSAGIAAMTMLLVQPVLASGLFPGLSPQGARQAHRRLGLCLVLAVLLHVAGLWITSPPDVIDALLFVSATPFSAFGVIAMWAVFGAAVLVAVKKRWRLPPAVWRLGHTGLVVSAVLGCVIHALLIEGTMEWMSKVALSILLVSATARAVLPVWAAYLRGGRAGRR